MHGDAQHLPARFVGARAPDEVDARVRKISVDSPMGRALLGKCEGDDVLVRRPKGEAEFTILSIEYEGL